MKFPIILSFLLILQLSSAAQKFTISGHIKDAESGESLIGAMVFCTGLQVGATANNYGFYSLTLAKDDTLGVVFSFLGYVPQLKKIRLDHDISLDILLLPETSSLTEVVVSAEKKNGNVSNTEMSVIDIPIEKIRQLPAILGEPDVLKIIQLLPGVQAGQEGTTGYYVRGGNSDQNMVLLDEAIVYNPNHLFGLFSTFNTRALSSVTLTKGGFPAQFGGRLSSVLNVTMKDGNNQKIKAEGGIGLITSNLTVEGPLVKGKSSFIVSARRTYADLILKPLKIFNAQRTYAFYDVNAKVNYTLGEKDRVFLSFFKGQDNAFYTDASSLSYGIKFGNGTTTLRWNHIWNQKLFSNATLIQNNYILSLVTIQGKYYAQFYSGINDWNAKYDFEYFPSTVHSIRFGINYTYHTFSPGGKADKIPKKTPIVNLNQQNIQKKYNSEMAVYFNDEIAVSPRVGLNLGVRVPVFISRHITYTGFEPRASMKYQMNELSSFKASATVMNQFLHLIPSNTAALPTDIWIPSSKVVKPQRSEQLALGYFRNFGNNNWETSIEGYYKSMQNQVAFKEGSVLTETANIDDAVVFGKGWSYGAELFIRKNSGRLNGWLSYTLSWTNQKFPDLNRGEVFPFKYDRRHNLSLVGVYKLSERWSLSAEFVFNTGNAYTLPVGRANIFGGGTLYDGIYYDYTNRNNARLNPYHRLDFSASYKKDRTLFGKKYQSEWVFGAYNIYSRKNPYYVYLQVDPNTKQPKATQVSLLPIIPSISFNFKF
jgi:hypothetical protein